MKTLFIVNPKAGKGRSLDKLYAAIRDAGVRPEYDADVYTTTGVGDAERFVREYCAKNPPARLIACGGDGTVNEVLNGMMGHSGFELGVLPIGTGNDFCRNFPEAGDFKSVSAQLAGRSVPCDAIRYETEGRPPRFCANMFNIGFDCNVADLTASMKQKPLISGSLAYILSILALLVRKKGADLKIELDGTPVHDGPLLLTSIANGQCCGGGIKSNPDARLCDGEMNVNIVYNVSRLHFLRLLPHYMKGTHMRLRGIEKVLRASPCKRLTVTPNGGSIRLCIDGEICTAGKTAFAVVPNAFFMVLPAKTTDLGGMKDEQHRIREDVCARQ